MVINDSNVKNKILANSKEKNKIKKMILALFFGGIIGVVAQAIYLFYFNIININEKESTLLTSATIIFVAFLMTCFGIFDKFVRVAHAGAIIPISGFANSITSCALEGKAEGLIFGIGSKMFSLIGSVCTYGIVSSIILGFIYFLIKVI